MKKSEMNRQLIMQTV